MTLFEITTGKCGESYVRCYVWDVDEQAARKLFDEQFPDATLAPIKALFQSTDGPFITTLSDCGFEK